MTDLCNPANYCRDVLWYGSKIEDHYDLTVLDPSVIYYGLELENVYPGYHQDDVRDTVNQVRRYFNEHNIKAILTEDGSLNRDEDHTGVEAIIYPYVLEDLLDKFKDYYNIEFLDKDYAGMHVHISTSPLSELKKAFIIVFFNTQCNRDFITKISGRSETTYAKFKNKRISDVIYYRDKYEVVNTGHPKTLEVRIFKANTTYQEFALKLEFLDALVHFVRHEKTVISGLCYVDLLSHTAQAFDFPSKYPTFYNFCKENNYLCV